MFYQPVDRILEEDGEVTMIDMAVNSTHELIYGSNYGDVLIFMPTESDIRETVDKFKGDLSLKADVLPLFGRLTMNEQNRIFRKGKHRKIVVSTNIAETSLTIPGIRYVVDTGYARISRYCPKTKTNRLPIEFISRSSAEQRKGRCGRVEEGICIRLYTEDEFNAREEYTAPEIKRSDLADVILRMLTLPFLGDIREFPFINPPSKKAIHDGLMTLRELGAIDEDGKITTLGRKISRLPIDPRTARILVEAEEENALSEVLIIAAALTIRDPRERPFDKKEAADEKHRRFIDKHSDFMTYLNLWDEYHDSWEELKTQNKMRKFCKRNFLSYSRMREWRDLHKELTQAMSDGRKLRLNEEPASYDSIHRSILSGFLGNLAIRKDKNIYLGRNEQEMMIFPGSGQFKRNFDWIVAAELLETSRLFAHTVAEIESFWIEPLAKHICNYHYDNPYWDMKTGRVTAFERVTLWGLVIVARRRVHYGRINRAKAREIFIREGLISGNVSILFPFLKHNLGLIDFVMRMENKIRKRVLLADQIDLEEFYLEHLPDVVDLAELKKFMRIHPQPKELYMELEDVLREGAEDVSDENYPDYLLVGTHKLRLLYHFDPEATEDGITLEIPENVVHQLSPEPFEWLIPGWLYSKIFAMLKNLPKNIRKKLLPISDRVEEILLKLPRTHGSLVQELENYLSKNYDLKIKRDQWKLETLPSYLKMRFKVIDKKGKMIYVDRNLVNIQQQIEDQKFDSVWQQAHKKWFLPNLHSWCCGNLPETVNITPDHGGIPHLGYPGLEIRYDKINRTLFTNLEEANANTQKAVKLLLEYSLQNEFTRLERSMTAIPKDLIREYQRRGWSQNLRKSSFGCLKRSLLHTEQVIRSESAFQEKKLYIRDRTIDITSEWIDILEGILDEYDYVQDELFKTAYYEARGNLLDTKKEVENDLKELFAPGFFQKTFFSQFLHYERYLRAMQIRLSRAITDPVRDRKKWQKVQCHVDNLDSAETIMEPGDFLTRELCVEYKWLIEEWKVSIFAQKLKTARPVSEKRLNEKWKSIKDRLF